MSELTERQAEIVRALQRGEQLKEIASRIGVSVVTGFSHKRRAVKKLGLEDACHACLRPFSST
jgi:DNA-binding NarL/FixJ family response regulator